jgi:hypothetical protein
MDEQQRQTLRSEHKLRAVRSDEEGLGLEKLPGGVYGFTYAPATETPLFARRSYHSFEVHKAVDGSAYLLAYTSGADAEHLKASEEIDVTVYPDPFENADTMVRVPFGRILSNHHKPVRYDGNALHLKLAAGT